MVIAQDTINGVQAASDVILDIQNMIYNYTEKKTINANDIKKIGSDKLSQDMFGFIQKLKNIVGHLEPVIPQAKANNKEFVALKAENEKLAEYSRIVDKIDEHMTDWHATMNGSCSDTQAPRIRKITVTDDTETRDNISKQLFFIGPRPTGKCSTCDKEPANDDSLHCNVCRSYFHASNCLEEHKDKKPCSATLLKNIRTASANFRWMCDVCSTHFEQDSCSTVENTAITLTESVNKLSSQMELMKSDMDTKLAEINLKIPSSSLNVWTNESRTSSMRSALLIKPDEHGKSVELQVIRDLAMKNGIQVNKATVTNTGNTFINLPSTSNRDKLTPLLQSTSVAKPEQIVSLK